MNNASGFTGYPIMDIDIVDCPPMHASTTAKYARILEQGLYITQPDGHMSYELLRATFGHFYKWIRNICLLSDTQALIDFVPPKKGKLSPVYYNLFTRMVRATVDGSVFFPPRYVSCMPIMEAPADTVHDFVMMTNEFLAPNGTILACDIIGNKDFQSS